MFRFWMRRLAMSLTLVSAAVLGNTQPSLAQAATTLADRPFLHPLFTDNMVLQRGISDPVWGWAKPGQKISVQLAGPGLKIAVSSVTAGADGQWKAKIGPFKAGGPYTLTVSGPQTVKLSNVMVGDVWICSGQSNMEFGMGLLNSPADIAAANNPNIRLFSVFKSPSLTPLKTIAGASQWDVCTPETVSKGGWEGFSAVAYFFGKNLQKDLNVPIGLIHSSWGGTIAEAWVSGEALKTMPDFVPAVKQVEDTVQNKNAPLYAQLMDEWWKKNDAGTAANWQNAATDASQWKTMSLPTYWEAAGLANFDGVVWFRKEVTIPDAWAGKELTLHLGRIDDKDTTFFNGTLLGATDGYQKPRDYTVPGNLVKAGRNVIVVRVLDSGGDGGLYGPPESMQLAAPGAEPIALNGEWAYKESATMANLSPAPVQDLSGVNVTTVLYNGMIAPLEPFGIKGAIWYQGESNADRAKQYRTLLPTLIKDWRNRFGVGEFPFLIVQLANFQAAHDQPTESQWAELREAQAHTAQTVPHSGLAVAIDIGDANDIHPKNKQEVGRRLALAAQATVYGEKIEYSGPVYKSMKVGNGKLRLQFNHATGLAAKNGEKLLGFAIAGADKKWVWADATAVGSDVVLSSPQLTNPTMARYDWADNPNGNLVNGVGLPAVPFRTDAP